jgi:hypothetical protein
VANDFGSAWNGSVFTVPAGMQGWYTISAAFQTNANGTSSITPFQHVHILVNGANIAIGTASVHVNGGTVNGNAPGSGSAVASVTYYCNAGDKISVIANHLSYSIPGNTAIALNAEPLHTYLSIFKH